MKRRAHGTGHVYRRHNVWWIAYHVGGKLVRESATTTVKREARCLVLYSTAGGDRMTNREVLEKAGVTLVALGEAL